MPSAMMTSKGQITIPKPIREAFNLKPGDRIEFLIDAEGKLVVWPITQDLTHLKGLVSYTGPAVSVDDMNQAIRQRGGQRGSGK